MAQSDTDSVSPPSGHRRAGLAEVPGTAITTVITHGTKMAAIRSAACCGCGRGQVQPTRRSPVTKVMHHCIMMK
jgi:hypothetical protein